LPQFLFHRPAIDKLKHGHYKWGTIGSGLVIEWQAASSKAPFLRRRLALSTLILTCPDYRSGSVPKLISWRVYYLSRQKKGLKFVPEVPLLLGTWGSSIGGQSGFHVG
jgi:hypothetical protein